MSCRDMKWLKWLRDIHRRTAMATRAVTAPEYTAMCAGRFDRERRLPYEQRSRKREDGSGFKKEFDRACEDLRNRERSRVGTGGRA